MLSKYRIVLALLLVFSVWISISLGQVVFEDNDRRLLGPSCTTPEKGNCVSWTKCTSLKQKIDGWNQMRPYLCGFAGTEPKVCCPLSLQSSNAVPLEDRISPTINNSRSPIADSDHTPTLSIPKTRPFKSQDQSNGKPDFLPDDCGLSAFLRKGITGGWIAEKGRWPWMAVIFEVKRSGSKSFECGGALVTSKHVITAAHCLVQRNTITPLDPKRLLVRLGAYDLSNDNEPGSIDVGVDAVRIHERYDPRVHTNDIAVLRLSEPVQFSNTTAPVCLPYDSLRNEDLTGLSSTVTGFGLTSVNGSYSDVLMEVSFGIQDQETCRTTYAGDLRIIAGHLCAGTLDGSKDSCQGDSGSPLMVVGKGKRYYLAGIVSFGKKCALPGYPVVYTRLTEYLDWLTPNLAD